MIAAGDRQGAEAGTGALEGLREVAADLGVTAAVSAVFDAVDGPVLVYFLLVNSSYLVLVALAAVAFVKHLRRAPFAGLEEVASSPLTQPVSVVVAAYDEEAGIVPAVRAMLALRYPCHEVVVVDDGSTDRTAQLLVAAFDLVEVPRVVPDDITTRERPTAVLVPADGRTPLVLVRKANSGRSDALNVGINAARHPLVCTVDADSILDPDALLVVSKPFADDPLRVVAAGGVVRAVNGCRVVAGRVVDVRMPAGLLARIQVVEYLRAFLLGRTGWAALDALVLISGAFGLYRRDLVVELGGLDPGCIGEDFELVMRIHRHMRATGRDYRVDFVAEPVLWTEVPSTAAVLARQRRRWHRGLLEVLWTYRSVLGNPRHGRIGLLAVPYYWAFELVAPVVELLGVVLVPLGLLLGAVDVRSALLLVAVSYGYALVVTLAALCVEEFSFHRYSRWQDLGSLVLAAVLENLGYRQLTAWWRVQGLAAGLTGRKQVWGTMPRTGFGDAADVQLPAARSAGAAVQ